MSATRAGQLLDLRTAVRRCLEVRAHPRAERLRLADVEDVARRVAEQVDARPRGSVFSCSFTRSSIAVATVAKAMRATTLRICATIGAALVLAPAAHAGGPELVLGATEDAVRAPTMAQAKAQMDLLALAGFRGVRITQIWTPGERKVSAGRQGDSRERRRGGEARPRRSSHERHEPGQQDDAADRRGSGRLRRVRGLDRERRPRAADDHRRKRAEPEPVLASPVQRGRERRRGARVREPARARPTTRSRPRIRT